MEDGGMGDEKIIAIPYGDPTYMGYTDIHELPKHIFEELKHFFTIYKHLEGRVLRLMSSAAPLRQWKLLKNVWRIIRKNL